MDLFSVNISSTNEVLRIEDSRCLRHLNIVWIVLGIALLTAYPAYLLLLIESQIVAILVSGLIVLAALIFLAVKVAQLPHRRIYIFDKKQGTYRFIESSFIKTDENAGKLGEIRKVKIEVTEYEDSESNHTSYKYQTFVVLDDFLAYDSSNIISVDEESGNYESSSRIAVSIAEFLKIPVIDETDS
jgi:hypothetical protein